MGSFSWLSSVGSSDLFLEFSVVCTMLGLKVELVGGAQKSAQLLKSLWKEF